jgi:HEAT repeat protein
MGLFGDPNIEKMVKKGNVKGLVKLLEHKDDLTRKKAIEALVNVDEPSVIEPIIQKIRRTWEPRFDVNEWKYGAINTLFDPLKKYYDTRVYSLLVDLYPHINPGVGAYKAERLKNEIEVYFEKAGSQAYESLVQMLNELYASKDQYFYKHKGILSLLAKTGDNRTHKLLMDQLDMQGNNDIKDHAHWLLGEIKSKGAVNKLIAELEDDHLVHGAIRALGSIGDVTAVDPLLELLQTHSDPGARSGAGHALGELRDRKAVAALASALNDTDIYVRSSVVEALEKIGDQRALKPLCEAMLGQKMAGSATVYAMDAIDKMYDQSCKEALIQMALSYPLDDVRERSMKILKKYLDTDSFNKINVRSREREKPLAKDKVRKEIVSQDERSVASAFAKQAITDNYRTLNVVVPDNGHLAGLVYMLLIKVHHVPRESVVQLGYTATDLQNSQLLNQRKPFVIVPKDIINNRPCVFHLPKWTNRIAAIQHLDNEVFTISIPCEQDEFQFKPGWLA